MTGTTRPRRGDPLASESVPRRADRALRHGYGGEASAEQVRKRAAQSAHIAEWRERRQLGLLGYKLDE